MSPSILEYLENFDKFPDDAIVPTPVSRILHNATYWTDYRNKPLPTYQISPGRQGHRVGDIRAEIRSKRPVAA
jgi:hypothetical protein